MGRAKETVEALQQQLADLDTEFKAEPAALEARTDPLSERLETVTLRLRKTQIAVPLIALVWMPHWQDASGSAKPAWE